MDRTLLVTGGAGFIGSNFLRHVLATDETARVVNLDKLTYAGNPATLADLENHPRHTFVHGDITDAKTLRGVFLDHPPDAVVHFAAESHVDRSIDSPEPFLLTNVLGTFRLLDTARRYWRDLPAERAAAFRFLHVSTDEVYGSLGPADAAFTETDALRAEQSLRRQQGIERPLRARVLSHVRVTRRHHQLLEQLRPVPVSRKAHPA